MRPRLLRLFLPPLASPGMTRAQAVHPQRPEGPCHATSSVPCQREHMIHGHVHPQLPQASIMSQRQAQRRQQAIDPSRAGDKVEDICRQRACAKSWLSKWRDRYDARNPAWAQERSKRPKSHPTHTSESVERAVVSLHLTLVHNGTGGGVTAITHALTQQGLAPVPSRRTIYRILRRHDKGVK